MGNDLAPYFLAAWLWIDGEDAAGYLQGQVSGNLQGVGSSGLYTLLLDHKGKVQADAFIGVEKGRYWAGSYAVPAAVLKARLDAFVVADDVTVEDRTAEMGGIAVLGSGARTLVAEARAALSGEGVVFPGRRCAEENIEWILPRDRQGAALSWLRERSAGGANVIDAAQLQRRRILAGIPSVPVDAGPGDLPQEAGLGDAVSYDKGCYVGQEVMARLKTRGRLRRRLRQVRGSGPVPPAGAPLYLEARKAGEMRSGAADQQGFIAWAMLAADVVSGASLRLKAEEGADAVVTLSD